MSFLRAFRSLSRLREVANLLFKEGFDEVLEQLHFKKHVTLERLEKRKKLDNNMPVRLRRVMEEAGGAFVKLGQLLSLRSDLIPQEYCEEFSKLQDSVKPVPFSEVKKVIEEDLGKPLNKIFASFNEKPIASASVGQVHKAMLITGQVVAVKVQRPNIGKIFVKDVELLYYLAEQAEQYLPEVRTFKPKRIVEEFEAYTKKELDYKLEAKNIDVFFQHYKYSPHIKIPQVYWDYTTQRVLTMQYLDGKKISDAQNLTLEQKRRITMLLYRSFITQFFDIHTFHADPHPGNILLLKNGKVAFLDFGIVGRVSPDLKENIEMMMIGLVKGDLHILAQSFISLGIVDDIDEEKFREDLFDAWGEFHGSNVNQIDMARLFSESFRLARKYNMEFPANFVLLTKAIVTMEGFGRLLYPDSNFIEVCTPQVEKIIKERYKPSAIAHSLKKETLDFMMNVKKFPQDLRTFLHILKTGTKVKVELEHGELADLTKEIDRSSHHLTLGLIISGALVSTGLLILANLGPNMFGIPVLAWIGVALTILLIGMLTVSMFIEKKGGVL